MWLYVGISNVCPWLAVLLALRARRENGFATVWDRLSGTRVVVQLKGNVRSPLETATQFIEPREDVPSMGPYQAVSESIPGKWMVAFDALLRRPVWLIKQIEPGLSLARKNVARIGRLRWLQTIEANGVRWNAFEATPGTPFSSLVKDGQRVPWKTLRQWLHDLAAELWAATSDQTLPAELSLDHVWITRQGQAVLLDQAWPEGATHAERIRVNDLAGQQRFLSAVAACAESTTLPPHARPVLQNLAAGKFEKLSFLTGNLRGLLDKPAEVTRQIRAGSMLLFPVYIWIMVFIGYEPRGGGPETIWSSTLGTALATALMVLGIIAVVQLLELPFRSTASHAIFRLAVINSKGERTSALHQLGRWAIMWLGAPAVFHTVAMRQQPANGLRQCWRASQQCFYQMPKFLIHQLWVAEGLGDLGADCLPKALAQPVNHHLHRPFTRIQPPGRIRLRMCGCITHQPWLENLELVQPACVGEFLLQHRQGTVHDG